MKKYLARPYGKLIWPVEVERETEKCVWIGGRRSAKRTSRVGYFDTFKDAKAFLLRMATHDYEIARYYRLERCRAFIGNVKGLKAP